jgi:hypothetical protein
MTWSYQAFHIANTGLAVARIAVIVWFLAAYRPVMLRSATPFGAKVIRGFSVVMLVTAVAWLWIEAAVDPMLLVAGHEYARAVLDVIGVVVNLPQTVFMAWVLRAYLVGFAWGRQEPPHDVTNDTRRGHRTGS